MDVLLNGVYVLRVFLGGVGVIHPQVADAAKLFCRTEVNDEGFAVANVEVPIGLRGETGVNLVSGKLSALPQVLLNESVNEIFIFCDLCHV